MAGVSSRGTRAFIVSVVCVLAVCAAVGSMVLAGRGTNPKGSALDQASVNERTVADALNDRRGTVSLVAAGDIAVDGGAAAATADLVSRLKPARVLALGDLAYPSGTATEFATWYAPTWGKFRAITWPVPGNHEYLTPNTSGFRDYFGIRGSTWRSWRACAWLVIGLDSEKLASTAQLTWLRQELRRNTGTPTLVMWHRPRFSSGMHGDQPDTEVFWREIARDPDVRIVLWGHDHNVERMSLTVRNRKVMAFVVGTGGAQLRPIPAGAKGRGRAFISSNEHGVLQLKLSPKAATWAWVTVSGAVRDRGSLAVVPAK